MPRSTLEVAFLLLLIAVGLVLVFSSGNSESGRLSGAAFTVMRPFQQAVHYVQSSVGGAWKDYVALRGVKTENDRLRREISDLKREKAFLENTEKENQRLKKLLEFKAQREFPTVAAQVIGEDSVGWYRTLLLNRGTDDHVQARMPVTVAEGVVGRVVKVSGGMSQVMLITDPDLSVDCRIVRTRDRGILTGSLAEGCVVRYLDLRSQVLAGDEVVTSGLDGVFPPGLPLGKVKTVKKGTQSPFLDVLVTPAADFSRLEEVLLILKLTGGFDIRPGLDGKR
ncbi:MAG: rod shape-determining protein MreC [Thermodesulfobacteriota bacterium]